MDERCNKVVKEEGVHGVLMGKKERKLIVRVLVMLVPTYYLAYISEAMIYDANAGSL